MSLFFTNKRYYSNAKLLIVKENVVISLKLSLIFHDLDMIIFCILINDNRIK